MISIRPLDQPAASPAAATGMYHARFGVPRFSLNDHWLNNQRPIQFTHRPCRSLPTVLRFKPTLALLLILRKAFSIPSAKAKSYLTTAFDCAILSLVEALIHGLRMVARPRWEGSLWGANCETGHSSGFICLTKSSVIRCPQSRLGGVRPDPG